MATGTDIANDLKAQSARVRTFSAGVAPASERSRKLIRIIGSSVVVLPPLGFLAAIAVCRATHITMVQFWMFLFLYIGTCLGISVGFHRYCSHHAFRTGSFIGSMLIILGSMAAQGPVIYWVANHRRHHSYADREGDIHSPNLHGHGFRGMVRGLWHAHTGWIFEAEMTDWVRYVPDLLRDHLVFRLNNLYFVWILLGLFLPALVGGLWTGTMIGALQGFLCAGLSRVFIVHHVTWAINSY